MTVLCWDFDGTLVLSPHRWKRSALDVLIETDSSIIAEDFYQALNVNSHTHTIWAEDNTLIGEEWWERTQQIIFNDYLLCGISSETALKASRLFREKMTRIDRYQLYPDTAEVLEELKERGFRHVMITNNYPDFAKTVVGLGLSKFFDKIINSGDVGFNKPRTEIFELAKQGYTDAEFWMIGDNPTADIIGGKQAGMKTVFVHKGHCQDADYCFDNLKSIVELLKQNPAPTV